MLQLLNQLDTETQHDKIILENSYMTPSTSKKVPTQKVTWSEFANPLPFGFHVMTKRQKRAFNRDAISSTEKLIIIWTKSLPSKKHCRDFYSIPLVREHHDS